METRIIPAEHWIDFFDQFSRDHVNWPVTIEVLDPHTGPQRIADELPFAGISFDSKGSRPSTIQITAGDPMKSHVAHVVDMPLFIRQANEPAGINLQIEPAKGPVTLVHLRGPMN